MALTRIPKWERFSRMGRQAQRRGRAAAPRQNQKGGFNPMQVLKGLEPGTLLTGKQLAEAARAITALELRPQLHGYKQLANQLTREKGAEASGLQRLGARVGSEIGGSYAAAGAADAGITASQKAIADQLNATSAGIAQQGAQSLSGMQAAALGENADALKLRGAPGGGAAQQQLAESVAAQQGAQANTAQSSQQFAAQQGASFAGLANAIASATQSQGAAARSGAGRETASRINKSNREYSQNIQTALGKLADVKATKGSVMAKNLLELQGNERKYKLGQQAVQGEKAKLGLEAKENAEGAKQQQLENKENAMKNNIALQKLGLEFKQFGLDQWEAKHPNAGSNEKKKKAEELGQDVKEVKSLIGPLVSSYGAPKNGKQLDQFILALNGKASADPALVAKVVKKWWRNKYPATFGEPGSNFGPW